MNINGLVGCSPGGVEDTIFPESPNKMMAPMQIILLADRDVCVCVRVCVWKNSKQSCYKIMTNDRQSIPIPLDQRSAP